MIQSMQHRERQREPQPNYDVTGLFIIKCEQMVDRNATASFLN